MEEACEGPTKI
jgi:hypothetical protein